MTAILGILGFPNGIIIIYVTIMHWDWATVLSADRGIHLSPSLIFTPKISSLSDTDYWLISVGGTVDCGQTKLSGHRQSDPTGPGSRADGAFRGVFLRGPRTAELGESCQLNHSEKPFQYKIYRKDSDIGLDQLKIYSFIVENPCSLFLHF